MKRAIALSVVLAIAGCAAAPSQNYRPANYSGAPWTITGDFNRLSQHVTIKINDKTVVDDKLGFFMGKGEFQGAYEGRKVSVSCASETSLFSNNNINCMVHVNGEHAATLTF